MDNSINKVIPFVAKITVREFFDRYPEGLLYAEGYDGGNGEGFFDFAELPDIMEFNKKLPEYFTATHPVELDIDMETVIMERWTQLIGKDDAQKMFNEINESDLDVIQSFVNMWLKYTPTTFWEIDKRLIVIPDEEDRNMYF